MKIKGIRHVGYVVELGKLGLEILFYKECGGKVLYDKEEQLGEQHTRIVKIQFPDKSIVELSEMHHAHNHIAFNSDEQNWIRTPSGMLLELVKSKK